MRDPLRSEVQCAANLRRAAPLARVEGDPQAPRPRRLERPPVCERVRKARFGTGQVEPGQAVVPKAGGRLGQADVRVRVMRPECRADQADDRARASRRAPRTGAHGRDPVRERQPARDVQERPPTDLEVADAVGGLGLDQLGRDALERLGVLEERDREVEGAEQLGLVGAGHRGDERGRHPGPRPRRVHAPGARKLERRGDAERAVEVEMQLRFRHRLDETPERRARQRVGHGLDATIPRPA